MKTVLSAIDKLRSKAEETSVSLPSLMLKSRKIAKSVLHGEHARRRPGTGENFWQFREYMPTDRPEDIDWRQSAKGDNVFIKQKEWLVTRKILFWCAGGKSMDFGSNPENPFYTKQENSQIMCLALALILQRSYEQIGAYGEGRTGRGEPAMEKLGQYLLDRRHAPLKDASLPDIASTSLPQHAIFIGVGDFLSPIEEIEAHFEILAKQTKTALIIQTLDPAEMELGFSGRVRFKGAHSEDEEVINNVTTIRDSYKQRINEHIKKVEELCMRYDWHYQLHPTDLNIADTLKSVWESIERGSVRK